MGEMQNEKCKMKNGLWFKLAFHLTLLAARGPSPRMLRDKPEGEGKSIDSLFKERREYKS